MSSVRQMRQQRALARFRLEWESCSTELNSYRRWAAEDRAFYRGYKAGATISAMAKIGGVSAPVLGEKLRRMEEKDWHQNGMTPKDMWTVLERERRKHVGYR